MREERDYRLASYLSGKPIDVLKRNESDGPMCEANWSIVDCILKRCPAIYECMGIELKD